MKGEYSPQGKSVSYAKSLPALRAGQVQETEIPFGSKGPEHYIMAMEESAASITVQLVEQGQCSVRIPQAGHASGPFSFPIKDTLAILAQECESKDFAPFIGKLLEKQPVVVEVRNLTSAIQAFQTARR